MSSLPTRPPLVEAIGVGKSFEDGTVRALDSVSVRIGRGELMSITGPSGSGKTTLLQILGTLRKPDDGRVLFEGVDYRRIPSEAQFRRRELGFVFQSAQLIPVLTARENVLLPLAGSGVSGQEAGERVLALLGLADILHLSGRRASHLSAGERQRVAVCRAFVNRPKLVLADEPTGFLDKSNRDRVLDLMARFNREFTTAIVVATHDAEVAAWTSRNLSLSHGRAAER